MPLRYQYISIQIFSQITIRIQNKVHKNTGAFFQCVLIQIQHNKQLAHDCMVLEEGSFVSYILFSNLLYVDSRISRKAETRPNKHQMGKIWTLKYQLLLHFGSPRQNVQSTVFLLTYLSHFVHFVSIQPSSYSKLTAVSTVDTKHSV